MTPPDHVNLCTREWFCFAVTMTSLMIEYAYMQTAYEELMKYKMKLGEANTSNDEVENMNSENFLARGRLKIAPKFSRRKFQQFISLKE